MFKWNCVDATTKQLSQPEQVPSRPKRWLCYHEGMDYLSLDKTSTVSMTHQIVASIQQAIARGELRDQTQLATEKEIADFFNISLGIVKLAYTRLEVQGLVVRIKGKGTFVSRRSHHQLNLSDFDFKPKLDVSMKTILIEIERVQKLREPFLDGLGEAHVMHHVALKHDERHPYELVHSYVGRSSFTRARALHLDQTQGVLLALESCVQACDHLDHRMYAKAADSASAALLNIAPNAPISVVERLGYIDAQLTLVQHFIYPGQYVTLVREVQSRD